MKILVSIGIFQEYILDNIKQLKLQGNNDIVLITEKNFFKEIDKNLNVELIDINEYHSDYIQEFKNKFSNNCSIRFIYIYEYMKNNDLKNIIYIENDNMIYENLDKFKDIFDIDKVYLTFDTYHRAISGIMYIPNYEILKIILDNYDMNKNDMENLGSFINSAIVEPFPIISIENQENYFNKNFKKFNCIFDGVAIGQYLDGVDKRNETCLIKYNKYKFYWIKIKDLWNPYLEVNNKFIKIINLNIYSKILLITIDH